MAIFSGHPTLHALLHKGEDEGTLEFGEIAAAVEELELEEGALDAFYAEAERRGIEVLDPARRAGEPAPGFHTAAIAEATSDSLQLFLRDISQRPLLTAVEEIELAKRIERGDQRAKDRMIESNLRLVVSNAKRCPEVRLPARLQVLDVCDLVDPPGDAARPPAPLAHRAAPGAHRPGAHARADG